MQKKIMVVLTTLGLIGATAFASSVDQSQTNYAAYADWGHGSGQTFTPERDGWLTGLEFLVEDNINPGTIEVYLWEADGTGKPVEPKLATGYLNKTNVTSPTSTWYKIEFDTPHAQSEGEYLAFTIFLVTSGTNGWNEYGYTNASVYANGFRINYDPPWDPGGFSSTPNSDWTFKTLIIPASAISSTVQSSTNLIVSTGSSETDAQYILQTRTDLINGTWDNLATNIGDGAALIWDVPIGTNSRGFFRLNIQQYE